MKSQIMNTFVVITGTMIMAISLSCSDKDNPVIDKNRLPEIPAIDSSSGSPGHQSNSQPINTTIKWLCSDPDDDVLNYDVYFGSTSAPTLMKQGITSSQYTPSTLQYSSTYYWKIVAHDGNGGKSESPVWSFTTIAQPTETVTIPSAPAGPNSGKTGESLSYTTGEASSSLGHGIDYRFDWNDGTLSNWSNASPSSYAWSSGGTYLVSAQARCATHTSIVSFWSQNKTVIISDPIPPELSVFPPNLDFDSTKTSLTFTIDNKGSGTLIWTASVNQSWISLDSTNGSTTSEIDRITVFVDRTGLSEGTHTGTIDVFSNGGDSTIGVILEVKGASPICSISPPSLDFDSVEVGKSKDLSFTITNTGGGTLTGSLSELCDDYEIISGNSPYNLTSGQNQTVTIRYSPDKIRVDSCAIVISPNCDNVICSGTGFIDPACVLNLSHLDFGIVQLGQSVELSFTIKNAGGGILTGVVSDTCPDFSIVSGGFYSLSTGQIQTVIVQFKPNITGAQTCTIKPGSNCVDVSCKGEGVQPDCQITVTDPTSSSSWTKGARHEIRWDPSKCSAPNVEIILAKGQSVDTLKGIISTSTFNDGMYSWVVDDFGNGTSSDYRIYINDSDNPSNGGRSEKFTITNDDPKNVTLNATADADISSSFPDINIGSSSTMLVGKTNSDGWLQSYVRFGGLLSSVPSGATIISAELVLTRRFWDGSLTIQITPTKRNWLESTITWNTQPGEVSSVQTIVNPNGGSNPKQIKIDVTQHVQEWIDDVRLNYGFAMLSYGAPDFEDVVQFYTRESSTSSYRPKLIVTYKLP